MASETQPLAVPEELKAEIRSAASEFGLSMSDTLRLALRAGIPVVREQLEPSPLAGLKPLTAEEARRCYEDPNPEFDALEHHCASLHKRAPCE